MPNYLDLTRQTLSTKVNSEFVESVRFYDEALASLKLMTLMFSRMMPIPDLAAKLAQASYSVEDIKLGGAIIARLYYNQIFGRPPKFVYDLMKLREVYETYDIPYDEPV